MRKAFRFISISLMLTVISNVSFAQTDMDAIMMEKKQLCLGPMYSYSSWKNYWEGTKKRENENLGTVSTQTFSLMGAYGVSKKLNLLFNVPYITTKASAGTLHGMKGIQDLSLVAKWMPIEKKAGPGTLSVYTIGGVSFPLTNYVADFLPLSIGNRSKTASLRLMLDYDINNWFFTASGTYVIRDNIKIDRTGYYTTTLHLTNEVEMPDATNFNFRAGYRSTQLVAEAVLNKWTTLGGFDISRNNMPFPSNRMIATTLGANFKYTVTKKHNFFLVGGAYTTLGGSDEVSKRNDERKSAFSLSSRNVGQSTAFYGGIFYVLDFTAKKSSTAKPANK